MNIGADSGAADTTALAIRLGEFKKVRFSFLPMFLLSFSMQFFSTAAGAYGEEVSGMQNSVSGYNPGHGSDLWASTPGIVLSVKKRTWLHRVVPSKTNPDSAEQGRRLSPVSRLVIALPKRLVSIGDYSLTIATIFSVTSK